MYVDGQRAAVHVVCAVEKLLKQLRVEYADEEVEARVVVRYDDEQRRLFLAERGEVKLVGGGKRGEAFEIEPLTPFASFANGW
jgi:hypothetical protein